MSNGSKLVFNLDAQDCKDLYSIMRRDFWVVTPCHSIANPGTIYEGTRLTIQVNLFFNIFYN